MKFAYADPPYYGCASFYKEHPDHKECDTIEWHQDLINQLINEFDGWALSMTSGNLHDILPLCPKECRIAAWVKPFASFKPGVNPAYAWEPVVFYGSRKRTREENTVRDWCSVPITLKKGLIGAKPTEFNQWICDLLGYRREEDEFVDLFPGTGCMSEIIEGRMI